MIGQQLKLMYSLLINLDPQIFNFLAMYIFKKGNELISSFGPNGKDVNEAQTAIVNKGQGPIE